MAQIHEIVRTLRAKPLHVRENIAIGVSGGVTLVVALGWLVATAASGTFTLAPTTFANDDAGMKTAVAASKTNFSNLLGAAGAAFGATTSAPTITVVDTSVHSTLEDDSVSPEQTVIHF